MTAEQLPLCGYGVAEVERILRIPRRSGYYLIQTGRLRAFNDSTGALKVSPVELLYYIRSREQ